MLFVVDVGNTNIVLGLYDGEHLRDHWRLETDPERTSDEYGILCTQLIRHGGVEPADVRAGILSSVVPPMTALFQEMCHRFFRFEVMVVGPGIKTGMPILYENPREVGADRVVNAVAAYERFHDAAIVVDFGTATTFDAISPKGEYLGGAIAPGIGIAAEALFRHASKLPRVELLRPKSVIGRNTVQSIQAGIVFGYVGLVDGIVRRMAAEEGLTPRVIATGGLAPLIGRESQTIEIVDEHLTLEGLRILYRRNTARE
jgi:type III pantothenate kinase